MPEPLTTAGTLVAIAKAVAETAKTLKTIIDHYYWWSPKNPAKDKASELNQHLQDFYGRLAILTDQLERSGHLQAMTEQWLQFHTYQSFPYTLDGKSDDEVNELHRKLRDYVYQTDTDTFSNAFFKISFPDFPQIQARLEEFRALTGALRDPVYSVGIGNTKAVRELWSAFDAHYNALWAPGSKVLGEANSVHNQLVQELKESVKVLPT